MSRIELETDNIYHIYNRGNDKRNIFLEREDLFRFLTSINVFNTKDPVGSIYEYFKIQKDQNGDKLVDVIAYCLNQNHFHFLFKQVVDNGIQQFMQRLGTGYTLYFNTKYKRSGSLFQGRYKAKLVDSDEYLLPLSVYVNLNNLIHNKGASFSKMSLSSWPEYSTIDKNTKPLCDKSIVLDQFSSIEDYKKFAKDTYPLFIENKIAKAELIEEEI